MVEDDMESSIKFENDLLFHHKQEKFIQISGPFEMKKSGIKVTPQ